MVAEGEPIPTPKDQLVTFMNIGHLLTEAVAEDIRRLTGDDRELLTQAAIAEQPQAAQLQDIELTEAIESRTEWVRRLGRPSGLGFLEAMTQKKQKEFQIDPKRR